LVAKYSTTPNQAVFKLPFFYLQVFEDDLKEEKCLIYKIKSKVLASTLHKFNLIGFIVFLIGTVIYGALFNFWVFGLG
jgi:hypothetical protein